MRWVDDPVVEETVDFTEPNLVFQKVKSAEEIRIVKVGFDYECHPGQHRYGEEPFWVNFEVSPNELRQFAEDLALDLKRFPERGKR